MKKTLSIIVFLALVLLVVSAPKAALADPVLLNEDTCNAMDGWHWYDTNGREGCWSKTLANSVSWNKGVGFDTRLTGSYTCTDIGTYDLATRMAAANEGKWYKIVKSVAGHTMATDGSEDSQAGATYISALAIADCMDGTKDLSDCDKGSTCTDWSTTSTWLRNWAGAPSKSALPYLATDSGDLQTTNDYHDACLQNEGYDLPLNCSPQKTFCRNEKVCDVSDWSSSWVAAVGFGWFGGDWETYAGNLGGNSCSDRVGDGTGYSSSTLSFRVVVRPPIELGGEPEAVPEFTTVTLIIAAVAGFGIYFVIKRRKEKK